MSWIKSIKNSKGGYDSFNWSIEKEIGGNIGSTVLGVLAISIISTLAPIFILLIYPISIKNHRWHQSVIGISASVICLIDYQFGFANWYVFNTFPEVYNFLCTINIIMLMIMLISFIFDDIVYGIFCRGVQWYWLLSILAVYFLYPVGEFILEHMFTMSTIGFWS
jgi:hypothetical protein